MSSVLYPSQYLLGNIEFVVFVTTDELNISHVKGIAFIVLVFDV
jgi:hypothetical protein